MLQPIPQLLHKKIGRWTGQSIFDCQMINLMNLLAICMRELAAGLGTDIVDRAEIVSTQKRTRHGLEDLVTVFVHLQKFIFKSRQLHLEILGNTDYISFLKIWS